MVSSKTFFFAKTTCEKSEIKKTGVRNSLRMNETGCALIFVEKNINSLILKF